MKARTRYQGVRRLSLLTAATLLAVAGLPAKAVDTHQLEKKLDGASESCYLSGISDRVRCGVVKVPENPAKPDGKQIEVHYAVLPAIKPSFPNEAFLAIAGGPGQSAIDHADGFDRMFRKVRQTRDILLIDQRGTGRSNLLACDDGAINALAFNDESADTTAEAQKCLDAQSADVTQYGSLNAVNDIEAVRKAAGYQKLHVYGVSYGTRMAQLYLKLHPEQVATTILDGVVPMQQSVIAIGEAIDRAVALLLADCKANEACNSQFPTLEADLAAVHTQLAQAPVSNSVRHPLTGEAETFLLTRGKFAAVVRLALYSPTTRALLPFAIHEAARGNYQSILGLYGMTVGGLDMAAGMHNAVVCGEDMHRIDAAMKSRLEQSYYGSEMFTALNKACKVWNIPQVAADFADGVTTDKPVLLLSGNLDPATPPSWAELAMANMGNARHLVAPYSGHGIARESCAAGVIAEFVSEGSAKELDTGCIEKDIRRGFYLNASTVEPLPQKSDKQDAAKASE
ncbi:alpha/beta hydrolase [Shewanella sp. JM162201]|uniref:Alpha/beta hydrolase n=1 Tax=Shewanella jiangmenensis TaxID=2837387 RepID=A0ABS5V3W1_9GAMM|nr:alpha/beta hydrolase [Shewanella jiangmenensis]MBT1445110.1 alpha/beta hydrolase [Shewanella jiangmenensis]